MKHNSNPQTLIDKRSLLSDILLMLLHLHFSYLNYVFFRLIKIVKHITTTKYVKPRYRFITVINRHKETTDTYLPFYKDMNDHENDCRSRHRTAIG